MKNIKKVTTTSLQIKAIAYTDLQLIVKHIVKHMRRMSITVVMLLLFSGCLTKQSTQTVIPQLVSIETINEQGSFDAFLQSLAIEALENSPLTATFTLGDLKEYDLFGLASQLDHVDLLSTEEFIQQTEENLKELRKYNRSKLSDEQKSNYDLAEFNLSHGIILLGYEYNQNLIQPSDGIQVNIPLALMQIEFESKDEIDAFVLRVKEMPRLFDEVIAYEKERYERGYALPGSLYAKVIEQIEGLLVEPEKFMMYLSFSDRLNTFEPLTLEEKNTYLKDYLDLIVNDIYPAFERLKEQAIAMESSKASGSISEWQDGKDYYEAIVKYKTSNELDVAGLESWATEELTNITLQFQKIIEKYPNILETDFKEAFPTYTSMEQVYDAVNEIYETEFDDYGVKFATENTIPTYLEEHLAAGFYFPLTVDGEDYGNMFLRKMDYENISADTIMLFYHENIPGHHLYYSYIAHSDEPLFRKMNEYLPYEEGWANYVQSLAYAHMGLQEGLDEFFRLNTAYSNAFMVLMDIKLHYDGLSVEEVIGEFVKIGYETASADAIVARMISKPGETIHYMYGEYKVNQWKKRFIEKLGSNFQIKEFHDFVLANYGLPFYVVDEKIERILQ